MHWCLSSTAGGCIHLHKRWPFYNSLWARVPTWYDTGVCMHVLSVACCCMHIRLFAALLVVAFRMFRINSSQPCLTITTSYKLPCLTDFLHPAAASAPAVPSIPTGNVGAPPPPHDDAVDSTPVYTPCASSTRDFTARHLGNVKHGAWCTSQCCADKYKCWGHEYKHDTHALLINQPAT